jgi:hypothetical protein
MNSIKNSISNHNRNLLVRKNRSFDGCICRTMQRSTVIVLRKASFIRLRLPQQRSVKRKNSELKQVTFLTTRTSTGSKVDVFHQSQPLTQSSDVPHVVRVVKNVTCLLRISLICSRFRTAFDVRRSSQAWLQKLAPFQVFINTSVIQDKTLTIYIDLY